MGRSSAGRAWPWSAAVWQWWFGQPHVVQLMSACYMLSIETTEIEVVTRVV